MALPATHLRFALEIAHDFEIDDLHAYLSGTLYPDSRWITGVDRTATHNDHCLQSSGHHRDFGLGWHVHCLCDQIQSRLLANQAPPLESLSDRQQWVHLSAAKMIQDQCDLPHVDTHACLKALDHIETPNGENPEDVGRYYGHLRKVYAGKSRLTLADYKLLWRGVGVDGETLSQIVAALNQQSADEAARAQLHAMFQDMLLEYRRIGKYIKPHPPTAGKPAFFNQVSV